jgi:hypothetical protein
LKSGCAQLASRLKSIGLSRIQRSAFAGLLDSQKLRDLYRVCESYATDERDVTAPRGPRGQQLGESGRRFPVSLPQLPYQRESSVGGT